MVFDVGKDKVVYSHNSDKYFIPASNTKIFTMLATLKTQGDSLAGFEYAQLNDTLFIRGTGDPSMLYAPLPPSQGFQFLDEFNGPIVLVYPQAEYDKYGVGWSWDDYNYTYSVERNNFPIYGNAMTFNLDSATGLLSTPQGFFKRYVMLGDTLPSARMVRDFHSNLLTYHPSESPEAKEFGIPFQTSAEIFARLLTDTLRSPIIPVKSLARRLDWLKMYSIPTDSAVKVMMQQSDNFIAEQLMIMNAQALTDTLDIARGIRQSVDSYMGEIPDKPVWVDGSGLSRFNLFTPRSIVWLWQEMYESFGRDRIFPLLAQGGGSGTLENYYQAPTPYLYGKTGTLSNNTALSGFLISKSGRLFIFSFMHNNYPGYSTPVKRTMERILTDIYENN